MSSYHVQLTLFSHHYLSISILESNSDGKSVGAWSVRSYFPVGAMRRLWGNASSMFLSDEELGKKDDDHRGARQATRRGQTSWNPARPASRRTLKRLVLALLAVFCVYFFIHNIPTDVGIRDRRRPVYEHPDDLTSPRTRQRPPSSTPKYGASKINRKSGSKDATAQTYDGPVHFLELGRSLQAVTNTRGALYNKHVLFSAASLKSAAILLPIACQMGSELRSYVHFALMGRTETELDELRAVNGVDEACNIIFHGNTSL